MTDSCSSVQWHYAKLDIGSRWEAAITDCNYSSEEPGRFNPSVYRFLSKVMLCCTVHMIVAEKSHTAHYMHYMSKKGRTCSVGYTVPFVTSQITYFFRTVCSIRHSEEWSKQNKLKKNVLLHSGQCADRQETCILLGTTGKLNFTQYNTFKCRFDDDTDFTVPAQHSRVNQYRFCVLSQTDKGNFTVPA